MQAMSLKPFAIIILGVCWTTCGCSIIENAARTLVIEPIHYCAHSDKYLSHHRHQRMAEMTWKSIEQAKPRGMYSADYAFGFRDGFADYLDAGPGNMPTLPPRRYWKGRYQTPEGHQAILDWYDGFGHGAQVAAAGGYRQFITLPSVFSFVPMADLHPLPPVFEAVPETLPTPAASMLPEPTQSNTPLLDPKRPDIPSALSWPNKG